jgi:hypothetical protein
MNVEIETVIMTDESGDQIQMYHATIGEREAYGRNRAQCLEELAYRLRKTQHEQVFHA